MKSNIKEIEKAIMTLKKRGGLEDDQAYLVFDKDLQRRIVCDELTPEEKAALQRLERMTTPELKKHLDGVLNEYQRYKKTSRTP